MNSSILKLIPSLVLIASCTTNNPSEAQFNDDLAFLMRQSKPAPYKLDSLVLQIYEKQVCSINYILRELEIDSMAEDEFIFIPLLASKYPVTFLSFPQIQSASFLFTPELVEVKTKSGGFYYLVSIEQGSLPYLPVPLDTIQSATLQCMVKSAVSSQILNIPMSEKTSGTAVMVITDRDQHLEAPTITAVGDQYLSYSFAEYPQAIAGEKRKYILNKAFPSNELISINTAVTMQKEPSILKRWLVIQILLLFLVFSLLFKDFLAKAIAKLPFYRWQKYKNATKNKEAPELMPKDPQGLKEKASFSAPDGNSRIEININSMSQTKSSQSKEPDPIQYFIRWLIFLIICMLFVVANTYGQPNPKTCLIDDIDMRLTHTFLDSQLSIKVDLNLIVITSDNKKKQENFGFTFKSPGRKNALGLISSVPNDVDIKATPIVQRDYKVSISSPYKYFVSKAVFKTLKNGDTTIDYATTLNKLPTNNKYNYITIKIPFDNHEYLDLSYDNYGFHMFPYDKRIIKIVISADVYCRIKQINGDPVYQFAKEGPTLSLDPQNAGLIVDGSQFTVIENSKSVYITTSLVRNGFVKYVLPCILAVLAVIVGIYSGTAFEKRLAKLWVSLGILVGAYKAAISVFAPGLPDALDFQGQFNYADFMCGGAVLLALLVFWLARRLSR